MLKSKGGRGKWLATAGGCATLAGTGRQKTWTAERVGREGNVTEARWTFADGAPGANQQLSHRVAAWVRENIIIGQLPPGQFLRTEGLAAQLKVSATPVREALMILQSEGAVHWEPRRGFRVVAVSDRDVRDLFEVQAFIAGELAARAAEVMSPADVDGLRGLQTRLEAAAEAGDVAAVDAANHEIHRRINKASGSSRLTALLNQTVQYVPLHFFGAIDGWAQASAHDHSPVFEAIAAGDAAQARKAMSAHIVHIGELLEAHLRARRDSS
jgi:DNA-binding GntR family transcriptional regulator